MRRDKLKEAREAAGKSQEKVAELVGVDRSSVSRWERGDSTPTPDQRAPYAESIDVTLQELHAMLSSIPPSDDEVPDWLVNYLAMEQSATAIQAHEPRAIYGLLQSSVYTAAVVRTVGIDGSSDSYVQRSIDQRLHRQQRVRDGSLHLDVIQPEWVLRIQMGTPETMAEQLDTMADLADLDNVTIRIAPFSAGQYEALRLGDFAIMSHAWGNPRVHLEGYGGGRFISHADEVHYFALAWERARDITLTPSDSVAFIRKQAQQWRDNHDHLA